MPSETTAAKNDSIMVCAGLSCLDLQLLGCTQSGQAEAIEQYEKAVYCAGGSASMTATTLALLCHAATEGANNTEIHVLTKLGNDRNGQVMLDFYKSAGAQTELCLLDDKVSTAMAVLPVFQSGGRACFFNLASNDSFTKDEMLGRLEVLSNSSSSNNNTVRAFLFGYPHLLPQIQGENLRSMLETIGKKFGKPLVGVDLNGVSAENHRPDLLSPALDLVDVLHLNEEEAEILSGISKKDLIKEQPQQDDDHQILKTVAGAFHNDGCAIVLLSLGSRGCFVSVTPDQARLDRSPSIPNHWHPSTSVRAPAFAIEGDAGVNANGAGDALFAGFCYAAGTSLTAEQAATFASLVARQRCDVTTRDVPKESARSILEMVVKGNLPPVLK